MASDWIKMRVDLYRDPKVSAMADALMDPDGDLARYVDQNCQSDMTVTRNVTRNAVVGALVTLWGVTRQRGKRNGDDLVCRGARLSVLDDIADLPGFGAAMASVGWVKETTDGVVFPEFFAEYNVDPNETASKKAAARQKKYRENRLRNRDVTRDVTVTSREEKNREEKNRETSKAKAGLARAEKSTSRAGAPGDDPGPEPPSARASPTTAGLACKAMRAAGIVHTNPSHPELLAAIAEGATVQDFADTAAEAAESGKGFAWINTTVRRRRAEAAACPAVPLNPGAATHGRKLSSAERVIANIARHRAADAARVEPIHDEWPGAIDGECKRLEAG